MAKPKTKSIEIKYRSEIFKVLEEYTKESFEYDPIGATRAGKDEFNAIWNDYTYQEIDPFLKVAIRTQKKLNKLIPQDRHDEIARRVALAEIDRYVSEKPDDLVRYYAYWGSSYNPLEDVAGIFEFMPKKTPADISDIVARLDGIPKVTTEWMSSLKDVQKLGEVNARCRVEWTVENIKNHADKTFAKLGETLDPKKENVKLQRAIKDAQLAFEVTAAWLENVYLKQCKDDFRLGERMYIKHVEWSTGLKVNPRDVYEFGLKEIERINKEMWVVAKEIAPKAKRLTDVASALDKNPRYTIHGRDELKKFFSDITEFAINELDGRYFTLAKQIRRCDVKLDDDTIDESPYYWGPSENLKRAGFGVYPTLGKDSFIIWQDMSTWYHETVPGHHMQIGTSMVEKNKLTSYQRGEAWNSGYGEGWALYSERLMDELGYFSDPGYRMGYLMNQAMRAARLVVDVGLHLGYRDEHGNVWNLKSAKKFMMDRALLSESYAESEIRRYVSWGGQAVSYKLGERVWLEAREEARERLGDKFSLLKFHMHALKLGPMGLDMLKEELAKWDGR